MTPLKLWSNGSVIWALFTVCIMTNLSFAAEPFWFPSAERSSPAVYGYTGLITTPSAYIIPEGSMVIAGSKTSWNGPMYRKKCSLYEERADMLGGVSPIPFIEGYARFNTEANRELFFKNSGDLSLNIKVSLPLDTLSPYLPKIALGAQDIGGEALVLMRTYYGVASKQIGPVIFSAGWGTGLVQSSQKFKTRKNHLKGLFGGTELTILPGLSTVADYDGGEADLGVRYGVSLPIMGYSPRFSGLVKSRVDSGAVQLDGSFAMTMNLTGSHLPLSKRELTLSPTKSIKAIDTINHPPVSHSDNTLLSTLSAAGFEDISITRSGHTHTVALRNAISSNNDDALAEVIRIAGSTGTYMAGDSLTVVLTETNIPIRGVCAVADSSLHWRISSLSTFTAPPCSSVANSSLYRPVLKLEPRLHSFIGTEVGAMDLFAEFCPSVSMAVAPGAFIDAGVSLPLYRTVNYETGKLFNRFYRPAGIDHAMAGWFTRLHPSVEFLSQVGVYDRDYLGITGQLRWHLMNNRFIVGADGGYYRKNIEFYNSYGVLHGAVNFPEWSMEGGVDIGSFWYVDRGLHTYIRRTYGVLAGETFYSCSWGHFGNPTARSQAIGISLILPLTPPKGFGSNYGDLMGNRHFSLGRQTTLSDHGGPAGTTVNYLNPYITVLPQLPRSIDNDYR